MSPRLIPRIGACAAVAGAVAQLAATILEPDTSGTAEQAVRTVAGSAVWLPDRLLDLVGVLLTVAALTIAARTLAGAWIDVATPFLILMGAVGAAAIVIGAAMKPLAQEWERADAGGKAAYLVAFDGTRQVRDALFFAAFLALGLYLAALAPAILGGTVLPRRLGWAPAVSAALILGGNLLSPVIGPSFLAVLAGFALFLATLAGVGISLWRSAVRA